MSISAVSSGSNTYNQTIHNNNEIKMLQKRKEQLVEQIKNVKDGNSDAKTKQELVKQLQEQIQQIETQIQQKKRENLTGGIDKNTKRQDENNRQQSNQKTQITSENGGKGVTLSTMTDMIAASSSYSKAKLLDSTKDSLTGKSNILDREIKTDEGRGGNPKAKKAELGDIKSSLVKLDKSIAEELYTSKERVEEVADADSSDKGNKEIKKEADKMQDRIGDNGVNHEDSLVADSSATDKVEKDPLTWALVNNIKYNKVDVQV